MLLGFEVARTSDTLLISVLVAHTPVATVWSCNIWSTSLMWTSEVALKIPSLRSHWSIVLPTDCTDRGAMRKSCLLFHDTDRNPEEFDVAPATIRLEGLLPCEETSYGDG